MPLVPVLSSMEAEGIKLDSRALLDYSAELLEEIKRLEAGYLKTPGLLSTSHLRNNLGRYFLTSLK